MFTKHIKDVAHLNYKDRLSALRFYSLQRRRERYLIIYVWEIIEVMNLSNPIMSRLTPKRGQYCETYHVNHGRIDSLRFYSFRLKSCRLFNSLPSRVIFLHVQF